MAPIDRIARLCSPSGLFADDEATRTALVGLGMEAVVIETFAAGMVGEYMELSGRLGSAAFRRDQHGKWTAAA
jgi:hypothetical protein